MKTYQRAQYQQFRQPGAVDAQVQNTFGMAPKALERHLRIMGDLQLNGGRISKENKRWLLQQAKEAGRDLHQAARDIARVEAIPDPERRARAYVIASGAPTRQLVEHAVDLSKSYATSLGSMATEARLRARDRQLEQSGLQYKFEDNDRIKHEREESNAIRRTIEATLRSQGLSVAPPNSLEEAQGRAKLYADHAANKMEALNDKSSLRDQIEAAWTVDQGMQRLNDAGVSRETMGSVIERTDSQNFAARGIDAKQHPDPRVIARWQRIADAGKPEPQPVQPQDEPQRKEPQINENAVRMLAMIKALRRRARPPTD